LAGNGKSPETQETPLKKATSGHGFLLLRYGQPCRVFPTGNTLQEVLKSITAPEMTWTYVLEHL
jgi:hypothetical protein